ncbi:MAG: heme NO-binding domain-containing protein [Gemmatimonadetes bacterium]|nr:heme NO-binding domain-containing protein [Gemmatimonadota bacterium]
MDGKLIGLVRHTVVDRYGIELWDSLARPCDSEEMPSDALAAWVGRETVPALRETYPSLFDRHADLASFVQGLGDDLPAVRSTVATSAASVSLRYGVAPDGSILLRIEAECSLCALIQGLIAGAAIHYDEPVLIGELKSPRRGDNVCVLNIEIGTEAEETGAPDLEVAVV